MFSDRAYAASATIQPVQADGSANSMMFGTWLWLMIGGAAAAGFAASPWTRLGGSPNPRWAFRPITGVVTFLVALLAGSCVVAGLSHLLGGNLQEAGVGDLLPLMVGGWATQLAVVAALPMIRRLCEPTHHRASQDVSHTTRVCSEQRWPMRLAVGVGLVGLLLFWPITQAVGLLGGMAQAWLTGEVPPEIAHRTLQLLIDASPGVTAWAAVICIAVIPGVIEELLYRGLLQTSLHRLGPWGHTTQWQAVILTSLIFAFMHVGAVELHALAALFVLSLGFGWAYAKTGRLAASITMHIGFNTGNLLLAVPWI